MKKMSLKEMQLVELEMLVVFNDYCKENGLKYSLGAGSLIGAVRHKGFIPWDDDIDIYMFRHEFEKLKVCLEKSNNHIDKYSFHIPGDNNYFYPYIKMTNDETYVIEKNIIKGYESGVWIDIFSIDYCSSNADDAYKKGILAAKNTKNYYRFFVDCKITNLKSFIKHIYIVLYRNLLDAYKKKLFENFNKYSKNEYMKYCGTMCWAMSPKAVWPSDYFGEYIECDFEGYKIPIFAEYDKILKHYYGDYTIVPDEKDRIVHDTEAYFK